MAVWLLALRLVVRIDHGPGLVLGRPQNHLFLGRAKLIDIIAADALELAEELTRLYPFAILAEADFARYCRERVGVHVVGELAIIEALGCFDGLRQHLTYGITKWDVFVAERVDLQLGGL